MDRSTQHAIKLIAAILVIASVAFVGHLVVPAAQRNSAQQAHQRMCDSYVGSPTTGWPRSCLH